MESRRKQLSTFEFNQCTAMRGRENLHDGHFCQVGTGKKSPITLDFKDIGMRPNLPQGQKRIDLKQKSTRSSH